jgi:hypothetical protein
MIVFFQGGCDARESPPRKAEITAASAGPKA